MSIHVAAPRRLLSDRPLTLALVLVFVGAVVVFGLYLAAPQVQMASTMAAVSEPAAVQPQVAPTLRLGTDCSVTGDLVGDANPAEVVRVLCGKQNERR
jgi:hypothetical protein